MAFNLFPWDLSLTQKLKLGSALWKPTKLTGEEVETTVLESRPASMAGTAVGASEAEQQPGVRAPPCQPPSDCPP